MENWKIFCKVHGQHWFKAFLPSSVPTLAQLDWASLILTLRHICCTSISMNCTFNIISFTSRDSNAIVFRGDLTFWNYKTLTFESFLYLAIYWNHSLFQVFKVEHLFICVILKKLSGLTWWLSFTIDLVYLIKLVMELPGARTFKGP